MARQARSARVGKSTVRWPWERIGATADRSHAFGCIRMMSVR